MFACLMDFFEKEWYYYRKRIHCKYYIICRSAGGAGFFSNYMWVLGHAIFARKLGYIPVVDMKNYLTLYSEDEPIHGEENAWNYYFYNIGSVGVQEAYESGRYVIGRDEPLHKYEGKYCIGDYRFPTSRAISYYAPFIQENIVIRQELVAYFTAQWQKKVGKTDHILGIHVRGTDMRNNLGHPVPASIQNYLDRTLRFLDQHEDITGIFLATDENNVLECFQRVFERSKWKFIVNSAFRIWDDGKAKRTGVHEIQLANPRKMHKYLLGREVLQDAWFLSRCDYLICGHSNITNVAILWNQNRFKQVVCIEEHGEIYMGDGNEG